MGTAHSLSAGVLRTRRLRAKRTVHRGRLLLLRLLLVLLATLAGCRRPPNRALPQPSPDGRYVFNFERGAPVIREGRVRVFRDTAPPFRKTPDLYWLWDAGDRLWIYDDAAKHVFYYERTPTGWRRRRWSGVRSAHPERDLLPPLGLYPPCAVSK